MTNLVDTILAYVGQPGSRWRVPTPALIVDLDRLDKNILTMAERVSRGGLALRPHAKTHKSAFVASRQLAAGAVGICCAKVGEAEALAAAGIRNLLITSPIVSGPVAERVAALQCVDPGLTVVVDHPLSADLLQRAMSGRDRSLIVLIDVDVGMARTGVTSPREAVALAHCLSRQRHLSVKGVQGYGGHWQHIEGAGRRRESVLAGMTRLTSVVAALNDVGFDCPIVSGGGTGTVEADLDLGVLTELQPGSYVFMDQEYRQALANDADGHFAHALSVQAQVISLNAPAWVTVDAGLKAFGTDGPTPHPMNEPFVGCAFMYFGDEHAAVGRPEGQSVAHGDRVELSIPHCDPTVDRYDQMFMVRGDVLIGVHTIDAARRSQ